jgi:hypothetical protein
VLQIIPLSAHLLANTVTGGREPHTGEPCCCEVLDLTRQSLVVVVLPGLPVEGLEVEKNHREGEGRVRNILAKPFFLS